MCSRAGGEDAGSECTSAACDDGIVCTEDGCDPDGSCRHTPDDSLCTAGPDGTCDPDVGCRYSGCGGACGADETCCAGSCVPAGCDDGIACTVDMCGVDGCEHAPDDSACDDGNPCTDDVCDPTSGCTRTNNTAACDDGLYCNGSDTCSGGSCSQHAGDPCGGSTTCDESSDACVGCTGDTDCPADETGAWGACEYTDVCDESGTRTRTVTTYSCVDNECVSSTSTESDACTRDTDGATCGTTSCDPWGLCGGFSSTCDEGGTQSRTCTDRVCSSGTCSDSTYTDRQSCTRDTDGTSCGSLSCGACSHPSTCAESGEQDCTDPTCTDGSCVDESTTRSCTRDTDGDSCSGLFDCCVYQCADGGCTDTVGNTCDVGEQCCEAGCQPDSIICDAPTPC